MLTDVALKVSLIAAGNADEGGRSIENFAAREDAGQVKEEASRTAPFVAIVQEQGGKDENGHRRAIGDRNPADGFELNTKLKDGRNINNYEDDAGGYGVGQRVAWRYEPWRG